MKVIGFNFTKLHAEKKEDIKDTSVDNNVKFTDVKKDSLEMLKDSEIYKIYFDYSLSYHKSKDGKKPVANVDFSGNIVISLSSEDAKEFDKSWKKKEVPKEYVTSLYNLIFRRCGAKSIMLQEELGLPSPFLKVPRAKADF